MKKFSFMAGLAIITLFLLVLAVASCNSDRAELDKLKADNQQLKNIAGPPPASLDQYFPPKAPAPIYLIEMFNLAGPLEGIGVDLQEQDIPGAKANYQAFKTQYDKVAGMVPEWKDHFPQEPVTALGKAIDSGNPAQIGPAMGKVGEVCGSCHLLNQVKGQQKDPWKNFDDIKLTAPVTAQPMAFDDYMLAMAGAYGGIATDLQENQLDNARKNFQAFNARFNTLATEACKNCHVDASGKEIPRKYFVDDSMKAMVNQLGQALAAPAPDAQTIQQMSAAIGNDSCLNCHLVHLPAQHTKDTWEQFKDVLK